MDEASVSPVLSDYTLHHSVYEKVHHGRHDLQTYNKPTYARLYGKVIRIGTPPRSSLSVTFRRGNLSSPSVLGTPINPTDNSDRSIIRSPPDTGYDSVYLTIPNPSLFRFLSSFPL